MGGLGKIADGCASSVLAPQQCATIWRLDGLLEFPYHLCRCKGSSALTLHQLAGV